MTGDNKKVGSKTKTVTLTKSTPRSKTPSNVTTTAQVGEFLCVTCNLGSNCPLKKVGSKIDEFCQKWTDLAVLVEYLNCIELIYGVASGILRSKDEYLKECIDRSFLDAFGRQRDSILKTVREKTQERDEAAKKITSSIDEDFFEHGVSSHSEDDRYKTFFPQKDEAAKDGFWSTPAASNLFLADILPRIIEDGGDLSSRLGEAVIDPHAYEYALRSLSKIGGLTRINEIQRSAIETLKKKDIWKETPMSKDFKGGTVARGGTFNFLTHDSVELKFERRKPGGRRVRLETRRVNLDLKQTNILPWGEYETKVSPPKLQQRSKGSKGEKKYFFTAELKVENKWFSSIAKTLCLVCFAQASYEAFHEPEKLQNWLYATKYAAEAAAEIDTVAKLEMGETTVGKIAAKVATPILIAAASWDAFESFGSGDYDAAFFHTMQVVGAAATLSPTGIGQVGGVILIAAGTVGAILAKDSKIENWLKNSPVGTNRESWFNSRGDYVNHIAEKYNHLLAILLEGEATAEAVQKKNADFETFLSMLDDAYSAKKVFCVVKGKLPAAVNVLHVGKGRMLGSLERVRDDYRWREGNFQWKHDFQGESVQVSFIRESDGRIADEVTIEFAEKLKSKGVCKEVRLEETSDRNESHKYITFKVPGLDPSYDIEPTELKEEDKYNPSNRIIDVLDGFLEPEAFDKSISKIVDAGQ